MEKKWEKLARSVILVGGCYFLAESIIHATNIRLIQVTSIWPTSALVFTSWMSEYYASFALLAALFLFIVQSDMHKYKIFVRLTGIWGLLHGILLIYKSVSVDFSSAYDGLPSLAVWISSYNEYLLFEACLLFIYWGVTQKWLMTTK